MADQSWLNVMADLMAQQQMRAQQQPLIRPSRPATAQPMQRPLRPMDALDRKAAVRLAQRHLSRGWTTSDGLDDVDRDLAKHAAQDNYQPLPDDERQRLAAQIYGEHEQRRSLQQQLEAEQRSAAAGGRRRGRS